MAESNSIIVESTLEDKTVLSVENGAFKCDIVPNDYLFLKNDIYINGDFHNIFDYPVVRNKIGLKVALMRFGIVFKEIIVKSSHGYYVSVIYNDYLNIFYSAVSYSEDLSLYMAYRRAITDIIQSKDINKNNQCQSLEVLSDKIDFDKIDYVYNKFCQDIEAGLIQDKIKAIDLNQDDSFGDYKIKFYQLILDLKKSRVKFVLGRLLNKEDKILSEKLCFNNDLSTAVDIAYISVINDCIYRLLKDSNIDWTDKLDYRLIYNICDNFFTVKEIDSNIKTEKISGDISQILNNSDFYTKSLIDFYKVDKISFEKRYLGIYNIYFVDTGFASYKEETFLDRTIDFDRSNDIYWRNLKPRINDKIKINYIGD